jgi:hypothetical protein
MNDTQDIAEVGSSAIVRLGESIVTPKARPDSAGWWWRWWRQRWVCGQVNVLDDSGQTLVWSFQSRMCDVAVLPTQFPGSCWVKAELPSFEPSAVEGAQALDAVPNA